MAVPLAGLDAGDYDQAEFPGGFHHAPGYAESNLPLMIADMRARIDATPPGKLRALVEHYWSRLDAVGPRGFPAPAVRDRARRRASNT